MYYEWAGQLRAALNTYSSTRDTRLYVREVGNMVKHI